MTKPARPKEMTLTFRLEEKDEAAQASKTPNSGVDREKYSTSLDSGLVSRMKMYGAKHRMRDNQVIEEALRAFLPEE